MEKIKPGDWERLVREAKECNLILENEKHCYTVTSNKLGCVEECKTKQEIVDSIKMLNYLQKGV